MTIRRLREERGFSQEGFADHAEIDRAFYGRIERGKQNIAVLTILRVARGLGVHPAELFKDLETTDISGRGADRQVSVQSSRQG